MSNYHFKKDPPVSFGAFHREIIIRFLPRHSTVSFYYSQCSPSELDPHGTKVLPLEVWVQFIEFHRALMRDPDREYVPGATKSW